MKLSLPIQRDNAARKDPGLANDCDLAARIKDGDRQALRLLVERHIGRLRSYLLHRLGEGQGDIIDRVVAATFFDALQRLGPYARGTASTPMNLWLIGLAERKLARVRTVSTPKARTPQPGFLSGTGFPSEAEVLSPQSDLTRLRAAMAHLPNRYRFVLALAVFEQMPAGDMAHALGMSPAGAMRRLRAALKRVGKVLAKQEEGDE